MPTNKIYSNVYNLKDIHAYYNDDPLNSKFFSVDLLPNILTLGKHVFKISYNNYEERNISLSEKAPLYFELYDKNDKILFTDSTTYDPLDVEGALISYAWLKEEPERYPRGDSIANGLGRLIIMSQLQGVPNNWKNKLNYKLEIPIDIRKGIPNISSLYFKDRHKIQLSASFSEERLADNEKLVFSSSYLLVSSSHLDNFGGQLKFGEISYNRSGSDSDDFKHLSTFPISASTVYESDVIGGLSPLSFTHRLEMPAAIKQDENITFKLRFLNNIGEVAQDIVDNSDITISGSSLFEGVPLYSKDIRIYTKDSSEEKLEYQLIQKKGALLFLSRSNGEVGIANAIGEAEEITSKDIPG